MSDESRDGVMGPQTRQRARWWGDPTTMPDGAKWQQLCRALEIDPSASLAVDAVRAVVEQARLDERFEGAPLPELLRRRRGQ